MEGLVSFLELPARPPSLPRHSKNADVTETAMGTVGSGPHETVPIGHPKGSALFDNTGTKCTGPLPMGTVTPGSSLPAVPTALANGDKGDTPLFTVVIDPGPGPLIGA